ncbi:hypothetical protein [Haemophilus paracuniculus]|uniref:hypothetical protein n=1 Tax=Haemophilus paracuniculus TaxID=734 RepID=UPI00117AB2CB|nr:hypothetical protein [Haemophilus paracuniculus]
MKLGRNKRWDFFKFHQIAPLAQSSHHFALSSCVKFQGRFVLFEPACWRVYKSTVEISNKRNKAKCLGRLSLLLSLAKQRK